MTIIDHMTLIDPKYGSQDHQIAFLERMKRADVAHPCTRDHAADNPPIHTTKCYPPDGHGRMVMAAAVKP